MEIKVQCSCGGKFAFDVEPVNGQMPCDVACPECGADATGQANRVIAENLARQNIGTPAPSTGGLKLSRSSSHASSTSAAPTEARASEGGVEYCSRHGRSVVESKCHICGKPICRECMQVFGYLCSAACRYKAEQEKIRVPVCEFQKSVAESKQWRKVGAIAAVIALIVGGLIGAYGWYAFVGSKPSVYYTWKAPKGEDVPSARFVDSNEMLLVDGEKATLRDIEQNKEIWTKKLSQSSSRFSRYAEPQVFVTPAAIWVCLPTSILQLNRNSGEIQKSIALSGSLVGAVVDGSVLVATSRNDRDKESVTKVDIATGSTKTQDIALTPVTRTKAKNELAANAVPTAGAMLDAEFNDEVAFDKSRDQVIPSANGTAKMLVKLVEQRLVSVQSIKPQGKTVIDEKLSASSSSASVAEEVFNDIKRSRTGGTKKVDESRYQVTIHRVDESVSDWSGEVTGPPGFFQEMTVDVLTAGKGITLIDKKNKKVMSGKLPYPVADGFVSSRGGHGAPCREIEGVLYFFDQGTLAAYALPAGNELWRLPSVGVSSVQPDGKGNLYVCTTTAGPEDIQYSDQIKVGDKTHPALLKVNAKTGNVLWKIEKTGQSCFLIGKFLYSSNHWTNGGGLPRGLSDALGSASSAPANFILSRIDPSNGKEIWYYNRSEAPNEIDFSQNKIMMVYDNRVDILKFMAF
jgi:outer membrane protein assembly factor BamB